jgi:dihydrofolate reductase
MQGGTTFHFVDGGIEDALDRAHDAAGDQDVAIGGGPSTIQQYLRAGLIDEMHVAIVPILLGGGERLFDNLDGGAPYDCVADEPRGPRALDQRSNEQEEQGSWT